MDSYSFKSAWYIICNPSSGGGIGNNKIKEILSIFDRFDILYKISTTQFAHHEEALIQKAIKLGYLNFICIGGDGTIHHMINGIMKQKYIKSNQVKLAVIPMGTGNDWVKNYNIPKAPEKAIRLLLNHKIVYQDIGKIIFTKTKNEVYFNNAAGIGFDAFVVKNISTYKKWGSLAYIIAALVSFNTYSISKIKYVVDDDKRESQIFLFALGICKYSGAGMQLTNYKNHKNGYFDLTLIKSIRLFNIITQILKLYNGKIATVKEAQCSLIKEFKIYENNFSYIQADGELVGSGTAEFNLIPNAIQFIVS